MSLSDQKLRAAYASAIGASNGDHTACLRAVAEAAVKDAELAVDEFREVVRNFYNLTIADKTVIIRPQSAEQRDKIVAAGDRLRHFLTSHPEVKND